MPGGIFRDLTGQRFGRLTVTERGPSRHGAQWTCRCDWAIRSFNNPFRSL
jgi:hypothetical protein